MADIELRFFSDETDLALARALSIVRSDTVYPGHEDLPSVPRGTLDSVWLPIVGALGLVIITRDNRIRYRPIEKAAWVDNGLRGFVLTSGGNLSTWDCFRILAHQWDHMEEFIHDNGPGPWMASVPKTGALRAIPL